MKATCTPSTTFSATQRMARIIVTLSPGKGIDKQEIEQTDVYVSGYSQGFLDKRTNQLQGWDNKWIAAGKNSLGSYGLFLIPQDMTGRDFIRIVTPQRCHCFIPIPRQAHLQEGYTYHYSIKIHEKKIEVMWSIMKNIIFGMDISRRNTVSGQTKATRIRQE